MSRPVSLSRLKSVSPNRRDELLSGLVNGAREPANGYTDRLSAQIAEYERRYELSSIEMVEQIKSGVLRETDDIASWLMLLKVRQRVTVN